MNHITDYDQFIADLMKEIDLHPEKKYRIILKAIKETECPYLRRKIRIFCR